jgi:hypothetical protein
VRSVRLFIIVLLCVLLPVRGAMAASLLCPGGAGAAPAVTATSDHAQHAAHGGHGHQADGTMPAEHAAHHLHASPEGSTTDGASGDHPTTCHFCASGCCMASLLGTVPSLAEPGVTARVIFPALTALVAAFQSDGQERPPRTR